MGLINYYHRHLENFLHSLEPLHGLLWNKVKWTWTKAENNAFENARELWSSANMLVYCYINKSLVLACNASPYWLWFVMFWAMGQKGLLHLHYGLWQIQDEIIPKLTKREWVIYLGLKNSISMFLVITQNYHWS